MASETEDDLIDEATAKMLTRRAYLRGKVRTAIMALTDLADTGEKGLPPEVDAAILALRAYNVA